MFIFFIGLLIGALLYYKLVRPTKFWEEKKVIHVPSWPIIGNMLDFVLRRKHFVDITMDLYRKFPDQRYVGYMQFSTPSLLIRDLELIKQVGIKQFDYFHDHTAIAANEDEPLLGLSLINLTGDKWKQMRATLSPAFTSSKMKNMYHLMVECAEAFVKHFEGRGQVDVEMKDVFSRFANDVIATAAFGIRADSLNEPTNEFYTMGKRLTQFSVGQALKIFVFQTSRTLTRILKVRMLRADVTRFFKSIIVDNIKERESKNLIRPDLIHLLMEARKGKLHHETGDNEKQEGFAAAEESGIGTSLNQMELTENHIVAQSLLFFFAGFETISTALSLIAYELAVHPDVQAKLQEEIDAISGDSEEKASYEALLSMKYLDQVVTECLRLWPPGFQTDRVCTKKEFIIEPKSSNETKLVLEKGTQIIIPIMAIHRDPRYYEEPERFDPERFSDENKAKILPGTYMPFGVGPRNCIGSRFALLEIKTIFFHLLSKFDIVPTRDTEIPLIISPKQVNLTPEKGFHLALRPRNKSQI